MKKGSLLAMILISMAMTIYPAKVYIKNETKEIVWARVNDQKRPHLTVDAQDWERSIVGGASQIFTLGIAEIVEGPIRAVRSKLGYPNFWSIEPGRYRKLGTAIRKTVREGGLSPSAIRRVTFLRKTGWKKVSGTVEELKKLVDPLTKQYGLTKFSINRKRVKYILFDGRSKVWDYRSGKKYTIEIPIVESFVYDFGTNPIRRNRYLKLTRWGNAVQGYETTKDEEIHDETGRLIGFKDIDEFKEIPQASPRLEKPSALRKWIREYKELRAKREAGTASPAELKRIDTQMGKIKKAAVAAGLAAAFMAGIAVGKISGKAQ